MEFSETSHLSRCWQSPATVTTQAFAHLSKFLLIVVQFPSRSGTPRPLTVESAAHLLCVRRRHCLADYAGTAQ